MKKIHTHPQNLRLTVRRIRPDNSRYEKGHHYSVLSGGLRPRDNLGEGFFS